MTSEWWKQLKGLNGPLLFISSDPNLRLGNTASIGDQDRSGLTWLGWMALSGMAWMDVNWIDSLS